MCDFILKYWVEFLFSSAIALMGFIFKWLYSNLKRNFDEWKEDFRKESDEQSLLKAGMISILHNELYDSCREHIKNGYISIQDMNNLEQLYCAYHKLGGNGTGTELFNRCKLLPIKVDEEV